MQKVRWQITTTIRRHLTVTGLVVLCFYKAEPSDAAVKGNILNKHLSTKNRFYKATDLHSNLSIPLMSKSRIVNIPRRQINARLSRYKSEPLVEPIQLTVSLDEDKILDLAQKIARPNSTLEVANYLKKNYPSSEGIPNTSLRLVNLGKSVFDHINHDALTSLFSKKHHEVNLSGNYLSRHSRTRNELLHQVEPFMTKRDLNSLKDKINTSQMLRLDRDLLPEFARRRVGRHTIFKGPNCFHAALAFQSNALASSSLVNVRQEPGYHRNMVNYDELWRILQLSFYEINPTKTPLQYGDMIVFFETNEKTNGFIDFKTLRHAATYLLGGYVFSKGSKSANSPYIVSTLGEEWKTWTKYTKKLGLKVFRRSLKNVTTAPPVDPIDWAY